MVIETSSQTVNVYQRVYIYTTAISVRICMDLISDLDGKLADFLGNPRMENRFLGNLAMG